MSLSDLLSNLASQAQQLEASAEAIRTYDHARIRQRKAELSTFIELARIRLGTDLVDADDQMESDRADDKISISESFAALKLGRAPGQRRGKTNRGHRSTQAVEQDALDDIEFAIYAIQEAEYSILDAATAWAASHVDRDRDPRSTDHGA